MKIKLLPTRIFSPPTSGAARRVRFLALLVYIAAAAASGFTSLLTPIRASVAEPLPVGLLALAFALLVVAGGAFVAAIRADRIYQKSARLCGSGCAQGCGG